MNEFPDTQIENYSQTGPYDYTLEWEHEQIEYFANYQDGKILNIQVIITKQEISAQHIFECLGEPRYYGAGVAGPQLSIGLTYPEKGVNVVGLVRDSLDLPSKDQPIMKIMDFARPTTNLNEFLLDISPFRFSDDATTNIHPWEGWDNIEIFGL
jgi:hypothetical protein